MKHWHEIAAMWVFAILLVLGAVKACELLMG